MMQPKFFSKIALPLFLMKIFISLKIWIDGEAVISYTDGTPR